jgi:hypothetical protein
MNSTAWSLMKRSSGKDQVLALADAGGHPDQAGQIDELGLGRDQGDAGVGARLAQFAHGGEGGEDVARVYSP